MDPDQSKWPKEWSEIYFKSYPRLKQVKLSKPSRDDFSLTEAILKRESNRDFSGALMNLEELSKLLFYSAGITRGERNLSRRAHPSGGARYPLEIYPLILSVEKTEPGIYHYNIKNHCLELLSNDSEDIENLKDAFYDSFIRKAAVILIISMIPWRSSIKYGNFALKVGLIESGHIGQNVYLMSQVLGLKCCALGGFHESAEEFVHKILDIDGVNEIAFYVIAVGK